MVFAWHAKGKNNRSSSDEENLIANVVHFTATVSKVCIDIKNIFNAISIIASIWLWCNRLDTTSKENTEIL